MKFLTILPILVAAAIADPSEYLILPGELTIQDNYNSKIASGQPAKKGENLDYVYLTIQFQQKSQTCGGFIYNENYVVTSARCVVDVAEGPALNVTVTLPQASGKTATAQFISVTVPDGANGAAALSDAYNPLNDVPLTKFAASNIAMVKLETPLVLDNKVAAKANISTDADLAAFQTRTRDHKFRACGPGVTGNQGQRPKGIQCTDVNPVWAACGKDIAGDDVALPEGAICLQWTNRDNNLCIADYGGPIWTYQLGPKGNAINQETFCVTIGSPDARTGAPCLDAHKVVCVFLPGSAAYTWVKNINSPPTVTLRKGTH